jgi:hypothetical protein
MITAETAENAEIKVGLRPLEAKKLKAESKAQSSKKVQRT